MSGPPIDERIGLGVAWLDERHPGWLDHFDAPGLAECLLRQGGGVPPHHKPSRYSLGFWVWREWGLLTDAWVKRIEQLRAERGAS